MPVLRRKRQSDGTFGPPEKVFAGETDKEKIERLEADNAQLIYSSMVSGKGMEDLESMHSGLIYQLMTKGVL